MKNITISLPDELHDKIKAISWVNWSAVARQAFYDKLREIDEPVGEVS